MAGLTKTQIKYLHRISDLPAWASFAIWEPGSKQTGDALCRRGYLWEVRARPRSFRISATGLTALRLHNSEYPKEPT